MSSILNAVVRLECEERGCKGSTELSAWSDIRDCQVLEFILLDRLEMMYMGG